jgi:uncharacterized protein YxjI
VDKREGWTDMYVSIKEQKMTLYTEYEITGPENPLYAKKQFFSLFNKVELQTVTGSVVGTLKGQFSVLRNRYEFDFRDGRVFHFECSDRLRNVYECKNGDDVYTLYEHRGLDRSIFRNGRQIAAYTKNRFVIGKGHEYEIRMDTDADLVVIVSMVLALSVSEDNDNDTLVSVDVGNLGFQGREPDTAWEPV